MGIVERKMINGVLCEHMEQQLLQHENTAA
jgi:hypothetical protein